MKLIATFVLSEALSRSVFIGLRVKKLDILRQLGYLSNNI